MSDIARYIIAWSQLTLLLRLGCCLLYRACEYADQQRYEGIWKQGRKEGRGTLKFPNGAFYEGRFRDDQIDGQGTIEIKNPVEDVVPGDWIIPLDIQVDVGRAHKKAGFDREGL